MLNWAEVAGNPSAASQLVNDLSMKVTSPNGTVYWGNDGLELGNESNVGTAAGPEDNVNSIECVFVTSPQAGTWTVEVIASAVVTDNHVETPAVDADYALVVSSSKDPVYAAFDTYGQGCQGSFPAPAYCATLNPNGGTLSNNTNSFEYCYAVTGLGSVQVHSGDFSETSAAVYTEPSGVFVSHDGTG